MHLKQVTWLLKLLWQSNSIHAIASHLTPCLITYANTRQNQSRNSSSFTGPIVWPQHRIATPIQNKWLHDQRNTSLTDNSLQSLKKYRKDFALTELDAFWNAFTTDRYHVPSTWAAYIWPTTSFDTSMTFTASYGSCTYASTITHDTFIYCPYVMRWSRPVSQSHVDSIVDIAKHSPIITILSANLYFLSSVHTGSRKWWRDCAIPRWNQIRFYKTKLCSSLL